jgi:hypothetical protein
MHYGPPVAFFVTVYTPGDVALLVEMDRTNEDVCGPANANPRISHLASRISHLASRIRASRP